MIESVPIGVVAVDVEGRVILLNAEIETMFGYARSELLGQHVETLLPERVRDAHVGKRSAFQAQPTRRAMGIGQDLAARRKDGSEFPVEIGLNPADTKHGPIVIATIVDINVRRRLERNFRRVVEASPAGMLMVDGAGRIALANERLCQLTGYDPAELLGQPLSMLIPPRHRAAHLDHREQFMLEPRPRAMGPDRDLTALHKDGSEIAVEIGLNPVDTGTGPMVLAAVVDISARKRLELDLRQANADLEEFAYIASHDLRSPLRGIADLIEWIAEDLGDDIPEGVTHNLSRVRTRIARLERLIRDLLEYARAGRASTKDGIVEVRPLLDDVLALQRGEGDFTFDVDCRLQTIHAARTPLEIVLRNLVSNAVKHHDRDSGRIDISAVPENVFCVFTVADDGPGIPPEAQVRVFNLFQTLSGSQESTGLGLALAKRLTESNGGRIELLDNGDARGATFKVWWPRFAMRQPNG